MSAAERFVPPDAAGMEALLAEHPDDLTGVVLRLAWRAGLTRAEIWALRWEQADADARVLRLDERSVPIDDETADALRRRRDATGATGTDYVAGSPRGHVTEQHLSRIARRALDGAGMERVRLIDLRHDFVHRALDEHGWAYALRVSGLSLATCRTLFTTAGAPTPPVAPDDDTAARLWELLQHNRSGAAGLGLWLSQQAYLTHDEIVRLTWDRVDLDHGVLHLPRGDVYMIREVIAVLREERQRRTDADDPHVVLSPRSRRPLDKARLSTLMRGLLARGGLEGVTAHTLRRAAAMARERERVLAQAQRVGRITRREVEQLLGVKPNVAYNRLAALVRDGSLTQTGKVYRPTTPKNAEMLQYTDN